MVINMGTETEYMCEKCGFIIHNHDLMYFVDEETNCVIEHAFGMFTFNMGDGSKIKGRIIPSFCPDCSSEVHFYYNEDESYINEIKLALKQEEMDFKDLLDDKYPYRITSSVLKGTIGPNDKTDGRCPKCGRKIPLVIGDKCKCPKCDGELYAFIVAEYD